MAIWQGTVAAAQSRRPDISGAAVSVLGIEKSYGAVGVVRGVSLDVARGEFFSLLGPSGSGKTTILMMVAGFAEPDAGTIRICGKDVTRMPANRRDVGLVFQRYALFPHMSVAENIAFPLKMRRVARQAIAARVQEALALVKLEGYDGRLPSELSGGQQQRVALARAIVFRPPVLLMDEPLAALDKKLRQSMQLEIKRLQRALGSTVLYVTHDQEEALTMSDRVAVVNQGRVEQAASPEELYDRPANAFVADFIGETNFLAGQVAALGLGQCIVRLDSGAMVQAQPAGELLPGSQVRLALRPERIRPCALADGLAGTVTGRIYAGSTVTHVVAIGPGLELKIRLPSGSAAWSIGNHLGLCWDQTDARAYPMVAGKG